MFLFSIILLLRVNMILNKSRKFLFMFQIMFQSRNLQFETLASASQVGLIDCIRQGTIVRQLSGPALK